MGCRIRGKCGHYLSVGESVTGAHVRQDLPFLDVERYIIQIQSKRFPRLIFHRLTRVGLRRKKLKAMTIKTDDCVIASLVDDALHDDLFLFVYFRTLLLSSFRTSRGHRCRPFSHPVVAFNVYRA